MIISPWTYIHVVCATFPLSGTVIIGHEDVCLWLLSKFCTQRDSLRSLLNFTKHVFLWHSALCDTFSCWEPWKMARLCYVRSSSVHGAHEQTEDCLCFGNLSGRACLLAKPYGTFLACKSDFGCVTVQLHNTLVDFHKVYTHIFRTTIFVVNINKSVVQNNTVPFNLRVTGCLVLRKWGRRHVLSAHGTRTIT